MQYGFITFCAVISSCMAVMAEESTVGPQHGSLVIVGGGRLPKPIVEELSVWRGVSNSRW